ncbi:MAG TPA: molybdopterin cofactor-binding domain-containing protein [Stellaceae bacterium]|nr:molybdopterin cofactor-binding domain-containing protein [Stellaceae bacterium]
MKPAPFHYHAPATVEAAVATLAAVAPQDGRILAGGQSLMPAMAFRLARPAHLVDINRVAGLDRLAVEDGTLVIGASVRHAAFHHPTAPGPLGRLLAAVVRHLAHPAIRARGTFCGSLAHADPAAEWCLVAATLDAEMQGRSRRGARSIVARDFFAGAMTTALAEDELLTAARLPLLAEGTRFGFSEFSRRADDYALAMALAVFRLEDGVIAAPRLGIGGAEARPRRMAMAEAALHGRPPDGATFAAAADAAAAAIDPLEDTQASAAYRRDLVRALTRRALERAMGRAEPSPPRRGFVVPPLPADTPSLVGRALPRLEDKPLLTGQGRFAADIEFPNQLHMRIVRSAHAHARLLAIDTQAAREAKGVVAVWTHADIADLPPIDFREGPIPTLAAYRQPVLARDRVRYVGEPVAAVFAEDPYAAEDAADRVAVTVEELPPLLDAAAAPGEFAPGRTTEATVERKSYGDIAAAFRDAFAVVALELSVGRHSGVPLETRGAIARYDATRDVLELHGAAKVPHRTRDALARMLGRAPDRVHLYEGHVGGGFGVRGELYPEDVLVGAAALRLGRPVKWIEDRREHLMATNHSRQQRHRVQAAVDREGRILGIDDTFFLDQGGYIRTHGARVLELTAGMLPGPYRVPAFAIAGHFRLTNKTPAATYRSPGRFEGSFVRERLVDAIAARLGLDRVVVRRRNLIAAAEMPFDRGLPALGDRVVYDSGDYAALLDKALAACAWETLQAELATRRAAGEAVGAGIAFFVEKSGLGPRDGVTVAVDPTGAVELITGGASLGQGFETVMAQICADALGCDYDGVRVIHGQTDRIAHGIGAHASRATVMTGSATAIAAAKLRAQALAAAAELLQTPVDALDIVAGQVIRSGGGASIPLGTIARHLAPGGLAAEGWHETSHMNYPYGVHIAVVRVDRATGQVAVERYLAAYDIGRAVNPLLVKGQIVGGVAQGLGGALYEEFVYDRRGEPLAVTFADYLVPTLAEMPPVAVLLREDAPSPLNPLGLKGAGEAGVTGAGAAIAGAIDDALEMPGAVTQLPVTPQRVRELLRREPKGPDAGSRHA